MLGLSVVLSLRLQLRADEDSVTMTLLLALVAQTSLSIALKLLGSRAHAMTSKPIRTVFRVGMPLLPRFPRP
jgi:hypothetical protein